MFDVEFLERNTLKSVIRFCFLQIRNRNGHTNNVKKKCDSISLSYGTRDSIWVPPNVAGIYMMCEKKENINTAQSKVNLLH